MPVAITPPTRALPPAPFPRLKWTKDAYMNLATMDILAEGGRTELIEGDIVQKMSVRPPHAVTVMTIIQVLAGVFGFDYLLTQFSLWVDDFNVPEPDVAVTNRNIRDFLIVGMPRPTDVSLVIEVSDATLSGDLTTKAALYARAGIAEYWVVDVDGRRVLVHRLPAADGFDEVTEYGEADSIVPLSAPDKTVPVADMLP